MRAYLDLLQLLLDHGKFKPDRTGTGTYAVFGAQAGFASPPRGSQDSPVGSREEQFGGLASFQEIRYRCVMPIEIPLREMSLPSKLELLEALWDDLSRVPDQLESPAWHEAVLEERRQRLRSGEEVLSDWEVAKGDIRQCLS